MVVRVIEAKEDKVTMGEDINRGENEKYYTFFIT